MSNSKIIYYLLHKAFVKVRAEGHAKRNGLFFYVADLLQNVPLELEAVLEGKDTYANVLNQLRSRGKSNKSGKWLEKADKDLEQDEISQEFQNKSISAEEIARETLHQFLYYALIDIRAMAGDEQNMEVWRLVHSFHNIPLWLNLVAKGKGSYDETLKQVEANLRKNKLDIWLEQNLQELVATALPKR